MANMAGSLRILRGELKYRDGVKKEIILKIDNNLTSMVTGIKKLNEDVSGLLTELVEQEKRCGGGNSRGVETDDDEEDDSDDDMEEETQKTKAPVSEPPAKRSKTTRT